MQAERKLLEDQEGYQPRDVNERVRQGNKPPVTNMRQLPQNRVPPGPLRADSTAEHLRQKDPPKTTDVQWEVSRALHWKTIPVTVTGPPGETETTATAAACDRKVKAIVWGAALNSLAWAADDVGLGPIPVASVEEDGAFRRANKWTGAKQPGVVFATVQDLIKSLPEMHAAGAVANMLLAQFVGDTGDMKVVASASSNDPLQRWTRNALKLVQHLAMGWS